MIFRAEDFSNPNVYVIGATGYWLDRWKGTFHPSVPEWRKASASGPAKNAMKHLQISLPDELFDELVIMAADCQELDESMTCGPEDFARECVESVMATRRLDRISSCV